MQKNWIDDEGRLRLRSEGNQFVSPGASPLDLDPWLSYDSWDAEHAVKLITIGYDLDIRSYWDEAKDWPEGSTGLDRGRAYIEVYTRGMSIAESSIAAGLLKNPDTPANWLAWAKRKGYKTDHLSILTAINNLEDAIDGCENKGVMESYTEQIVSLKQLAAIIEPLQPDTQPQAARVESDSITHSPAPLVEVSASQPLLPLTTGDIAHAFGGLHGWSEPQWKKPLGDKPNWLANCVAIPGARGLSETRWNPVLIGAALIRDGSSKVNQVRARFQTKPQLAEWFEAWKTYEADNFGAI